MNLLILGAGVDKTEGINMPLANGLIPEIAHFVENEGKNIDTKVRSFLPSLRFSFVKFIREAIDDVIKANDAKVLNLILNLEKVKLKCEERDQKIAEILIMLLKKICTMQEDAKIDDNIYKLIEEVYGHDFVAELQDDSIIEIEKVTLSDSFRGVMRQVIKDSIKNPNNILNKELVAFFLNLEDVLIETFLGFYNKNTTDIKRYLYISWILWAYLKYKEKIVYENNNDIPFYKNIPKNFYAITLNYTSFISKYLDKDKVIFFHGSLNQYIRMDLRDIIDIDESNYNGIEDFLEKEIATNINFDQNKFVIPSIIPPLKLKPILSNKFLKSWYRALEWIKKADRIIIIGYSFNYADEHFNDMIRENKNKEIIIIDPNAESMKNNLHSLIGYRGEDFTNTHLRSNICFQCQNIKIIKAKADEIDLNSIIS